MTLNLLFTFVTCVGCFAPILAERETSIVPKAGSLRGGSRRLQRPTLRSLEVVVTLDRFGQFFGDRFEDLITKVNLPIWIVSLGGVDLGVTDSNGFFETQEDPPDFLLEGGSELCVRIEEPEALSSASESPVSADSVSANTQPAVFGGFGSGSPSDSTSSGNVRRALRVFARDPCYTLQEEDFNFRTGGPLAAIRFTITAEESTFKKPSIEEPTAEDGDTAARVVSGVDRPPLFASIDFAPTPSPSSSSPPSLSPTASGAPTTTVAPSSQPSTFPSTFPTDTASSAPSSIPSDAPSGIPSSLPSISTQPSAVPSAQPSSVPTLSLVPSIVPSSTPTSSPSVSVSPSSVPSMYPSATPSASMIPSDAPSSIPSMKPSVSEKPSDSPSPSKAPSSEPSTSRPSDATSMVPSSTPTVQPSISSSPSVTSSPTLVPVEQSQNEQFSVAQIAQQFIAGGGLN